MKVSASGIAQDGVRCRHTIYLWLVLTTPAEDARPIYAVSHAQPPPRVSPATSDSKETDNGLVWSRHGSECVASGRIRCTQHRRSTPQGSTVAIAARDGFDGLRQFDHIRCEYVYVDVLHGC